VLWSASVERPGGECFVDHAEALDLAGQYRTLSVHSRVMRTQRLELRLTDAERELDTAAASAVGETLSDFFRRAASSRASEVLADQRKIALSEDEAVRFLDALETVDASTVARLRELRARA
jgi:uncharacterized protein (DUF1778 family)